MTIYEIATDWKNVYDMADDPEINEEAWFETIEMIQEDFDTKCENYCKLIKQLEADAEGVDKEAARLVAKKQALTNKAKALKVRLQQNMEFIERTEVVTPLFKIKIQQNAPSVFIPDESRVPVEFLIAQAPKIDKKGISAWLKEGNTADWAELTRSSSVRIR